MYFIHVDPTNRSYFHEGRVKKQCYNLEVLLRAIYKNSYVFKDGIFK
jgi:hypothetical protein